MFDPEKTNVISSFKEMVLMVLSLKSEMIEQFGQVES